MSAVMTPSEYKKLKTRVQTILSETAALQKDAVEQSLVRSYWKIGQHISKKQVALRAGYHNTIIKRLASDLGIAQRTLQYTVAFFETYRSFPKEAALKWGHIIQLVARHDREERAYYEQQILLRKLSVAGLRKAIKSEQYNRARRQKFKLTKLNRPKDQDYLYPCKDVKIVDADTMIADIDTGYFSSSQPRIRLAGIDAPDKGTAFGQKAKDYVLGQLARSTIMAIKTEKADTYGRFIAHIFYLTEHSKKRSTLARAKDAYQNGHYLNQELIDKGYARAL